MAAAAFTKVLSSAYDSPTFGKDASFRLDKPVGSASISPCGRDIVLASRQGLHIIDLDSPYSVPRHLPHHTSWEVADVQWSPFSSREAWVVSTSNQKALLWNLEMNSSRSCIEHVLHGHTRAITDINFSAHHPDILATCAVDSFVHCWDIRHPRKPALSFCDWFAGATQVKWNRQEPHVLASSHDKMLRIWDDRKGAYPLRSIEAHATKIYGVDWDRTDSKKLITCSLDKTIKFWDYADTKNEAYQTIHTGFPVWRARHTPFGTGLLAMPQRENNDLHLYDRRTLTSTSSEATVPPVHRFQGHESQVKEFLWCPRGTVNEAIDNREFQLVSWGSDRVLRLHRLGEDVLQLVGYERGQQPKAHLNFTRRDAVYKTFREDPPKPGPGDYQCLPYMEPQASARMRARLLGQAMSKGPIFGSNTWSMPGHSMAVNKVKPSQEMDPISWMKGVKIGKQISVSGAMRQSLSSLLSPGPKADRAWENFDSLGEEIACVGEKFSKVAFEEVDMSNRRILIAFPGPWGSEKKSVRVKCRIQFPNGYPDTSVPSFTFEASPNLSDGRAEDLSDEISQISTACCEHKLSSLEAILRYLLGESTLEETLLSLKARSSSDLDAVQSLAQSSSDEDDEDLQVQAMDMSQEVLAVSNTQYNVPLPKACGALWANDGRLICFFPQKEEKVPSLFDTHSLRPSERSTRSHKAIFEGFGRFNRRPEQTNLRRSLIAPADSDSEGSVYSYSSSESTSSIDDFNATNQLFLPAIGLREARVENSIEEATGESQWSSGDPEHGTAVPSNHNYVTLHDFQDLLPSRPLLARKYILSDDRQYCCVHNARVAREADLYDLADIWDLVGLMVDGQVPLELALDHCQSEPAAMHARRATHPLKSKDSAIDLSFDANEEGPSKGHFRGSRWGRHPFGQQWLVEELMAYLEGLAYVQMLAMVSCVLSESKHVDTPQESHLPDDRASHLSEYLYRSAEIYTPVEHIIGLPEAAMNTPPVVLHNGPRPKRKHASTTSDDPSARERAPRLSTTVAPSISFRHTRASSDLYIPQNLSFSTSPERLRRVPRSSSNLASAFAASLSQTFSLNASAPSSPPTHLRNLLSPAGSYIGAQPAVDGFGGTNFLGKSAVTAGDSRTIYTLPVSDTEDEASAPQKPVFETKYKNQDKFELDSYAGIPLFAISDDWKRDAYRAAYAEMLFAWELPIQRCEVLKYNSSQSFAVNNPRDHNSDTAFRKSTPNGSHAFDGIDFIDNCPTCANPINANQPIGSCSNCSIRPSSLLCLLCTTIIRGLASPCLSCGHALHPACRALLQSQPLSFDDPACDDDQTYHCISGCGCLCDSHTSIEILVLEQVLHDDSEDAETIIVNEQESLGWRDEPQHDVAYESLVRNLGERRALTPKSSQIWRGGEVETNRERKKSVGSSLRYEGRFGL